ncbi:DUF2892 domain-containing protein [bacterium]|nr:DUF2892 domain-containing protein [bacterium]MBU1063188.1 DUF2892 domain-containing protein [bacterium]MBU1635777.1 DUF2892 domain-containing protein [bacterium]MBU1873691.1 DUF2892 domain-containing protein [bacterium]
MKCNVGKTDKIIRWIIGIVAIALGIFFKSWWGAVGLIPIVTASMSFCPIYSIVGLSSCKVEKKKAE